MMAADAIKQQKRTLREHFKQVREGLGAEQRTAIDAGITRRLLALDAWRDARAVLPYLSFGSEVDTHALIEKAWEQDKVVALPWCVPHTRQMRWFRVTSFDGLARSSFGVLEPVPSAEAEIDPGREPSALAIVPGLTFDLDGCRIGYGGGFYDVFLSTFHGTSAGLCREVQMSPDGVAALDGHDLPVDLVVTEDRVIRAGRAVRGTC